MSEVELHSMSETEARSITERIRSLVISTRDQIEKLQGLLNEAKGGNAWAALGYASWTAYLADVMADQPLRLPRDQRQEIVGYLAGEGMSSRAIAPIVGATDRTVRNDMAGGKSFPPEPEPDYVTDQTELDETLADAGFTEPEPQPERKVTGLDGKTYTRPEPAKNEPPKPKRKPLTESFFEAKYDLARRVESLHRLTQDERFPKNAEKVAQDNLNDLIRTRDLLHQVIESMSNNH